MSLLSSLVVVALAVAAIAAAVPEPASFAVEKNLCERYPYLRICALRKNLDEAMNEIAYLVQTVEQQQQAQIAHPPAEEVATENNMQKRKSAFVRFGKRSVESMPEGADADAQNPLNVMLNSRPTRKSSYIRFG